MLAGRHARSYFLKCSRSGWSYKYDNFEAPNYKIPWTPQNWRFHFLKLSRSTWYRNYTYLEVPDPKILSFSVLSKCEIVIILRHQIPIFWDTRSHNFLVPRVIDCLWFFGILSSPHPTPVPRKYHECGTPPQIFVLTTSNHIWHMPASVISLCVWLLNADPTRLKRRVMSAIWKSSSERGGWMWRIDAKL